MLNIIYLITILQYNLYMYFYWRTVILTRCRNNDYNFILNLYFNISTIVITTTIII